TQDRSSLSLRRSQTELLIVDEEESFVMAVIELRYFDRSAEAPAELIEDHQVAVRLEGGRIVIRPGFEVAVIEPVVGVERFVAMVFVKAGMILIGAFARRHFDLNRAFTRALGSGRGGR